MNLYTLIEDQFFEDGLEPIYINFIMYRKIAALDYNLLKNASFVLEMISI